MEQNKSVLSEEQVKILQRNLKGLKTMKERKERRIVSFEEIGANICRKRQTVSDYFNNPSKAPNAENRYLLAKFFDVSEEDLFDPDLMENMSAKNIVHKIFDGNPSFKEFAEAYAKQNSTTLEELMRPSIVEGIKEMPLQELVGHRKGVFWSGIILLVVQLIGLVMLEPRGNMLALISSIVLLSMFMFDGRKGKYSLFEKILVFLIGMLVVASVLAIVISFL